MRLGDVECDARHVAFVDMSNVLNEAKKQQVLALRRLGWPLRRIEQETGVRRETAGAYLKAAGIGVRTPGAWGRRPPAKPANEDEVTTGSDAAKPSHRINSNSNPKNLPSKGKAKATAKPANADEVTTGARTVFPRQTWRRLAVWWCVGGSNTWLDDLSQPVLEVPGEATALGVEEGISVCV